MRERNKLTRISQRRSASIAAIISELILFLLIAGLLLWTRIYVVNEKPINYERVQERIKARDEIEPVVRSMMESYGWQDKKSGVVRLPVSRAMEIVEDIYKDRATARSNFLMRVERTAKPILKQ